MGGCEASPRPAPRRRFCTLTDASKCPSGRDMGGANARMSAQLSLRLDARLADDSPPLRYFRPEAGGALLGRAGDRLVTERCQAFLHVRPDYGLCNVPLQ